MPIGKLPPALWQTLVIWKCYAIYVDICSHWIAIGFKRLC